MSDWPIPVSPALFADTFDADDLANIWDTYSGTPVITGGLLNTGAMTEMIVKPKTTVFPIRNNYIVTERLKIGASGSQYHGLVIKQLANGDKVQMIVNTDSGLFEIYQIRGGVTEQSGGDSGYAVLRSTNYWILAGIYGHTVFAQLLTADPEITPTAFVAGVSLGHIHSDFAVAGRPGAKLYSTANTQGEIDNFKIWPFNSHPFNF